MIPTLLALLVLEAAAPASANDLYPPEGRRIRVAFVLTENAVMIDFAGPWEVFQDVMTGTGDMSQQMPFELYTVGPNKQPVHTSGGMKKGMTVIPDYGFADAPTPDAVVVGAQSGDEKLGAWLRKVHDEHALIMSVCTGAFRLAQAGLLAGKPATTQHESLQRLANQYPDIAVRSSVRFVEAGPLVLTAGGLSSEPISPCRWSSSTSGARLHRPPPTLHRPPPTKWSIRAWVGKRMPERARHG